MQFQHNIIFFDANSNLCRNPTGNPVGLSPRPRREPLCEFCRTLNTMQWNLGLRERKKQLRPLVSTTSIHPADKQFFDKDHSNKRGHPPHPHAFTADTPPPRPRLVRVRHRRTKRFSSPRRIMRLLPVFIQDFEF